MKAMSEALIGKVNWAKMVPHNSNASAEKAWIWALSTSTKLILRLSTTFCPRGWKRHPGFLPVTVQKHIPELLLFWHSKYHNKGYGNVMLSFFPFRSHICSSEDVYQGLFVFNNTQLYLITVQQWSQKVCCIY